MTWIVLLNRRSGTNARVPTDWGEDVGRRFRECGVEAAVEVCEPAQLRERVEAARARRPDAVVIGGGDGSVSAAAAVLVDGDVPLGVLPLGTLNHFAKDLGLPSDWSEAVPVLAARHVRRLDVAEVNGRVFINNCSIGAYPAAVRRREMLRQLHGHSKSRAMTAAVLEIFRRQHRLQVRIEVAERVFHRRTPLALVANNRYRAAVLSPSLRERLDGGSLWVYTTREHRLLPLIRLAYQSVRHGFEEADALDCWSAPRLTLTLPRRLVEVALDGEVVALQSPLRFRSRPRSLPVLGPPES